MDLIGRLQYNNANRYATDKLLLLSLPLQGNDSYGLRPGTMTNSARDGDLFE